MWLPFDWQPSCDIYPFQVHVHDPFPLRSKVMVTMTPSFCSITRVPLDLQPSRLIWCWLMLVIHPSLWKTVCLPIWPCFKHFLYCMCAFFHLSLCPSMYCGAGETVSCLHHLEYILSYDIWEIWSWFFNCKQMP